MAKRLAAELWIKLKLPGAGQIGPGKIELLKKIDQHGSMAAAARAMGMSYRRAWLLVDELNKLFTKPLVEKHLGGSTQGGASLTDFGRQLVQRYDALVRGSIDANGEHLAAIAKCVRRPAK
ncbi:MAG TPA: LysR family transcriptional regulator [Gammaproteobacteria bacterium]|nr:LysR family transcriptional regulator [Gammaproteobacteria bacterium]